MDAVKTTIVICKDCSAKCRVRIALSVRQRCPGCKTEFDIETIMAELADTTIDALDPTRAPKYGGASASNRSLSPAVGRIFIATLWLLATGLVFGINVYWWFFSDVDGLLLAWFVGAPIFLIWLCAVIVAMSRHEGSSSATSNGPDPLEMAAMSEALVSGSFRSMNTVRYQMERRRRQ